MSELVMRRTGGVFGGNLRAMFGLVVSAVLVACGGGGGGGGESSPGANGNDTATGIRVFHAVIDGAPVDLFSSARSEALTSKVFFSDSKGYRSLPSGEQTLRLSRALDSSNVVASLNVTSTGDDSFSILYYGSFSGDGVQAKLLEDVVPNEVEGAAVRFVNGVEGASALIVNASGSAGAQQVLRGAASDYIVVGAGAVRLTATRAADGQAILSMTEALTEGGAYTVLVSGEVGYYTKGTLFRDR